MPLREQAWGGAETASLALLYSSNSHPPQCLGTEDAHDTIFPFLLLLQAASVWHPPKSQDSAWSLLYSLYSCAYTSITVRFSLDLETVKAGSTPRSGNTEQNLSTEPPLCTGVPTAGNHSKPHWLALAFVLTLSKSPVSIAPNDAPQRREQRHSSGTLLST